MFQTETNEEVIFVSEKRAHKSNEIAVDQAKRLDLQRDIDQQSQPRKLGNPLTSQGSVAVERPVGRVNMKTEEKSEQGFVKRKKLTKGQADDRLAEVKKKKKSKIVDVIVIDTDGESVDGSGEQIEKKKRKIVTESLNGSRVKNGNDKEVSKKKKQQLKTALLSSVEVVEEKRRTVKKLKNKPVKIKAKNVRVEKEQEEEQHAESDELPKKDKKRKNILVVNAEETEEQVKEKKKKKTPDVKITDEISIKKKRKSAKVTENGVKLVTPERDTYEVEEVKVKQKNKKCVAKEDKDILATPQMKGNNKRSKAASGQNVEKDDMLHKKKDKSTKSEIVFIDEEETKPKTNGKKVKGRKVSVEVSQVEQKEPKKKRKTGNSKGEREVPLLLNCEEVEEQSSETVATEKNISIKVEPVSFGTGAKKRKIKEEVEDQHASPLKDVVFLSSKTGNTDEVNINQERRQALQVDIDTASQPLETKGLGQWTTAQFDSSAKQQKFFQLMGGFKKGFQPAAGRSEGANMALGKNSQQQLQQGLLGEFERAQSRRMDSSNRGSGLGFSAPVNKKFFIDVNACRSVRFDD